MLAPVPARRVEPAEEQLDNSGPQLQLVKSRLELPLHTMLKRLVELRNRDLRDHEQRVGRYASILCRDLNLDPEFSEAIRQACSFHDLGKVVLPDAIIVKPSALTCEEWDVVRQHCALGYEILKHGTDPITRVAATVALTHHESFDGLGYPCGLKGYAIPLEGRIAGVCDVYDALREHRVYRPGLTHEEAMHIMLHGDGNTRPTQFDPDVMRAFARNAHRYAELFDEYQHEAQADSVG